MQNWQKYRTISGTQLVENMNINKESDVKFWLNWENYRLCSCKFLSLVLVAYKWFKVQGHLPLCGVNVTSEFWEGHKNLKNLSLCFHKLILKKGGRFLQKFWPSHNIWTSTPLHCTVQWNINGTSYLQEIMPSFFWAVQERAKVIRNVQPLPAAFGGLRKAHRSIYLPGSRSFSLSISQNNKAAWLALAKDYM